MQSATSQKTQSRNPRFQILAPTEGETIDVMGAPLLVKSTDPKAAFIAEQPLPPGYHVPLHFHDAEDESFYVLDGEVTFEGEDGIAHIKAGGFVHCPRGARHGFRNETDRPARILVVATAGGGLGPMFREFDRTTRSGAALTPDKLTAIAAQNGIRIV